MKMKKKKKKILEWVYGGDKDKLPQIDDWEDFPEKYLIRVKGDGPRSGYVHVAYVDASDMREIKEDYWEWLKEEYEAQ